MANRTLIDALLEASTGVKIAVLAALTLWAAVVVWLIPPIAQDQAYHAFADRNRLWGIPHFGDVASNLGFLLAGVPGLVFVLGRRGRQLFHRRGERWPYLAYFAGLALTFLGSGYYHLDPNNATLVWDRLALIIPVMALLAAFIVDRVHARLGVTVALPLLLVLGIGSVISWYLSELAGHGDLRFYGLVQAVPVVLIPLICLLFRGRHTSGKYVVYMFLWYALARVCELFDQQIHGLLGGLVSGHTLKHLTAAAAAYTILAMLRAAAKEPAIG